MIFTKNKNKTKKSLYRAINILILFSLVFSFSFFADPTVKDAEAYLNMVKEGSFETNIDGYWTNWQNTSSERNYNIYRSYDSAFGFGSHSVGIRAMDGSAEEAWTATFMPREDTNKFSVESGKSYYLAFYIKASQNTQTRVTMSNTGNYEAIDGFRDINITRNWDRHVVLFNSSVSSDATFSFTYGNLSTGNEMLIDGVQLFEDAVQVVTPEIRGNIGQTRRYVRVNNISFFTQNEIEIELPYYDENSNSVIRKRFNPSEVNANGFYMNLYEGTFSGIASVYAQGNLMGEFDYNIVPVITDFFPSMFHADEDVVIRGSGFNPQVDIDKMYVVIKTMDIDGKTFDHYIKPHIIDPKLKQVTVKLPVGVVAGSIFVQTSFRNIAGEDKIVKSNALRYDVKPVIYSSEWSRLGFDQVGDKIRIHGKGISSRPIVNFYDDADNKVASMRANLVEIGSEEIIEVATPVNLNKLNITVQIGRIESDRSNALAYSAKPIIKNIKTAKTRFMSGSENNISAAKAGEEITIYGNSLHSETATSVVEFQGLNTRIQAIPSEFDVRGGWIKVVVPNGVQNGYLNTEINGLRSNYLPLEIIPTVLDIQPSEIVPGTVIGIHASGVGSVESLTKVYFGTGKDRIEVTPESIENFEELAVVHVRVPMSISNNSTTVNLQYDKWLDDSSSVLNVDPTITNASMDVDSKILVIRGYGFSIHPRENKITYRYADENKTIIEPRVRILGVYPTEEGQEIRIKVEDDYHYGYVQVAVGDRLSNEFNFGPVSIRNIARRVQYVESENQNMGVLYINGYNFGENGGVRVGENWATVHYRTNFFIIAVVPVANVNDNPIIITKE